MTFKQRYKKIPWVPRSPRGAFRRIAFGWGLAFFGILGLLNFHPLVKTEGMLTTPLWVVWLPFLLGLFLMVLGYRAFPEKEAPDLKPLTAGLWLTAIMAAGIFLRLYHLGTPPGPFWDDWATNLVWVRNILDKNRFYWMLPSDGIEPFVPYVITALQALLPDEVKDFTFRRLASCLIDMGALWLLYLTGKEISSRRMGILAAGLGALGRPMIQLSLTGMRAFSLSLAVTFLILATLNLFRKQSLGHFLLWGFALAFGVHTYSSFRVYIIILPFLLIPWVFQKIKGAEIHFSEWLAFIPAVFLLLGVFSGTFSVTDPRFTWWSDFWNACVDNTWMITNLFIFGFAACAFSVWSTLRKGLVHRLAGWSLAVFSASLMIFPLTLSVEFNGRMGVLSPFRDQTTSAKLIEFFTGQLWQTLKSLFYACRDRNDLTIATDPFYDLFSQGALLLGLAYLIARPNWKKIFLLGMGALGTLVYIISFDYASTKLIASAAPFYLLAAWAASRLWSALPSFPRKRRADVNILISVFLASYGIWGGWVQYKKLFGYWAQIPMTDTVLAKCVGIDEPNNRVYLAPSDWFFGWSSQFALNEGRRFYILKNTNLIPMSRYDKPENIVIFVYGSNFPLIKNLQREFPRTDWGKIFVFPHSDFDPNPELYMWRVFIPKELIDFNPEKIIRKENNDGSWLVRSYNHLYGWSLSGVLKEERAGSLLNIDFSKSVDAVWLKGQETENLFHPRLFQMIRRFEAGKDGSYEWAVSFPGPIWFKLDGETLWKRDTPGNGNYLRYVTALTKGTHSIELRARFPQKFPAPRIYWKEAGSVIENPL